jgi:hypothetical protein
MDHPLEHSPVGRTSTPKTNAAGRNGLRRGHGGWVLESGQLTGTGLAHVRELSGGIVIE